MNYVLSKSWKYRRSTSGGWKYRSIRKLEFEARTHFLYVIPQPLNMLNYIRTIKLFNLLIILLYQGVSQLCVRVRTRTPRRWNILFGGHIEK